MLIKQERAGKWRFASMGKNEIEKLRRREYVSEKDKRYPDSSPQSPNIPLFSASFDNLSLS